MRKLNIAKNEQGLAMVLELIVAALVVGVVGFMIWNVHLHRQAATTSSTNSTQATTSQPAATTSTTAASASLDQASSSLDTLNQDLSTVDQAVGDKEGNLSQ